MDIGNLSAALESIRRNTPVPGSRAATYLMTYPALLSLARHSETDKKEKFLQIATATYGWMPRIVRLDPPHLNLAVQAFTQAQTVNDDLWREVPVNHVAQCFHSVVGASKLLHFANPNVFPIWDRNVERIYHGSDPTQNHMGQVRNYVSYAGWVHELRGRPTFKAFYEDFIRAYEERLDRLGITRYRLTEVRAVEAAAFELAGDENEI